MSKEFLEEYGLSEVIYNGAKSFFHVFGISRHRHDNKELLKEFGIAKKLYDSIDKYISKVTENNSLGNIKRMSSKLLDYFQNIHEDTILKNVKIINWDDETIYMKIKKTTIKKLYDLLFLSDYGHYENDENDKYWPLMDYGNSFLLRLFDAVNRPEKNKICCYYVKDWDENKHPMVIIFNTEEPKPFRFGAKIKNKRVIC